MKKLASLMLILPMAIAIGAIDFTPLPGTRVLDGIKFQQLVFYENGRKITYEQPAGWTYRAEGSRIVFAPSNVNQAEAVIEQSHLETPQTLDDATVKLLQEQAVRSVPASSLNIKVVSAEKNPILVNRLETFEVTVSYRISGQAFRRSVLFLNLPDTQLRFRVTARDQDFEKIHRAFRGSLYSWQWP